MAEKVYGYKKEEVIGKNIDIIIPEWKKEDYSKIMKDVLGGKIVKNSKEYHNAEKKQKRGYT